MPFWACEKREKSGRILSFSLNLTTCKVAIVLVENFYIKLELIRTRFTIQYFVYDMDLAHSAFRKHILCQSFYLVFL